MRSVRRCFFSNAVYEACLMGLIGCVVQVSFGFSTSPLMRSTSLLSLHPTQVSQLNSVYAVDGAPPLLRRPCNHTEACVLKHIDNSRHIARLTNKVSVLEDTLAAVFACLLHCDDIALLERQASAIGDIYMDSGFTSTRKPRMLRQEIKGIAQAQGIQPKPIMHKWHYRAPTPPPPGV